MGRLAAGVIAVGFAVVIIGIGLRVEVGAVSRRGCILHIKGPDCGAVVSCGSIQPTYDPDPECKGAINPVFGVVIFIHLVICWFALREAIGPVVFFSWDVNKLEVEE